ncbi:ATP-binding protein [Roseofilum casamattae]|uniref:ATP-binding protein n=1 Tax=Roseofilum casamattae BLCC-M143 TaxID=3022442 RepID=A0ABT7BV24_9CYAN|nr:ATP-binding protein [Roseofilum casamattae]MDJ1183043.1 ATP-binding protein [Roseofilum casamattae BLCC-M143]
MTALLDYTWQNANQHHLMQKLGGLRQAIAKKLNTDTETTIGDRGEAIAEQDQSNYAIDRICATFSLSSFERDILLLCAGVELDETFLEWLMQLPGNSQNAYPTFALALHCLDRPHWSALTPDSPLRYWRLLELGTGPSFTLSPLRIDESILHYLAGVKTQPLQLEALMKPVEQPESANPVLLMESDRQVIQNLIETWIGRANGKQFPLVQLCGEDSSSKQAIAATAFNELNLSLYSIEPSQLPTAPHDMHQLLRLWHREAFLKGYALLINCDRLSTPPQQNAALMKLIREISTPAILTSGDRMSISSRAISNLEVNKPSLTQQSEYWQTHLEAWGVELNGQVQTLISQFNLTGSQIQTICTNILSQESASDTQDQLTNKLWQACRQQARPRMDDLAQRIHVKATWDDIVLPNTQMETLQTMAAHLRQRAKVYENWGFARKSGRGLGISALFAGPSGTGKTTAAEVLANTLELDLYKIDLSSVVSKYIGETEKNLRRVFDAAESGGTILLFDEADALFGKRSEVKDSHDRHANIEVSYLLQRMEAYQGLAILTTNLKGALDNAFMRRIRFVIQFSFPDVKQRAEIWRRIFPKETPTQDLDCTKLAKLSIAGGNIRNIALNSAFLAAEDNEPVQMKHILQAAKSEYVKLEKPLLDSEVKGWLPKS